MHWKPALGDKDLKKIDQVDRFDPKFARIKNC